MAYAVSFYAIQSIMQTVIPDIDVLYEFCFYEYMDCFI